MKNNLLNRYLLPSYIASVLFIGTAGATAFFAKKSTQMAKEHADKQEVVDKSRSTCILCLLIATASIIMAVFCGLKYPMLVKRRIKTMTKHYLQDIFVRHPEIRQYRSVLENSKKLHEIAAIACNGLTDDEQKEILNFVKTELNKSDHSDIASKLCKIEAMIVDTVQKHAIKDPEYMDRIMLAITNAQNANFIEAAQKVR